MKTGAAHLSRAGFSQVWLNFNLDLGFFVRKAKWITRRNPRLALRAIRYANVRFGILPTQSRVRGNDDQAHRATISNAQTPRNPLNPRNPRQ